ncbi:hypothetical protein SAMN06265368_3578 [Cohaesibacter gelatinilyticus]|uniref:Uncharacterized protein n=1 Tax=Cohaesibacter gelatinilyticus TaxID=372072 RepID=A0A285PFI7_9HYPH|nr:hypothetical protein SAMN06265368_3578 [Cohaesibacter gelatinilyticus]
MRSLLTNVLNKLTKSDNGYTAGDHQGFLCLSAILSFVLPSTNPRRLGFEFEPCSSLSTICDKMAKAEYPLTIQ